LDFQADNVFVRKAIDRAIFNTTVDIECYHYINTRYFVLPSSEDSLLLKPKRFVTIYGYYTSLEAQQSLALPGLAPTHVIKFKLPANTNVQGPAWIDPMPSSQVFEDPQDERFGNGVEILVLNGLKLAPADYEVLPLNVS